MCDKYEACRKCRIEFSKPINKGRVALKKGGTIIVVDGYCWDCCMKLQEVAKKKFEKFLENHPEFKEAYEEYWYYDNLRTSAIMLD